VQQPAEASDTGLHSPQKSSVAIPLQNIRGKAFRIYLTKSADFKSIARHPGYLKEATAFLKTGPGKRRLMKHLPAIGPRVLSACVLIIITTALHAVPSPWGWDQFNLKDTVEAMTVSGGNYSEPTTFEFSIEGMLLWEHSANSDYEYRYKSDADWNIGAMTRTANGEALQVTRFEYDSKGTLVKAVESFGDEDLPRTEYYFDASGKLTEKRFVTFMRDNNSKYGYQYNSAGQMVREDLWMGDGSHEGWTTYSYDSQGGLSQEKSYYSANAAPDVINYVNEYDERGNITRTVKTEAGNPDSQSVTTFSYRYYEVVDGEGW